MLSEPYYLDPVNVFLRNAQLVRQIHNLLRGGFFDLFQGRFVVARLGTETLVGALQLVTQFLFPPRWWWWWWSRWRRRRWGEVE